VTPNEAVANPDYVANPPTNVKTSDAPGAAPTERGIPSENEPTEGEKEMNERLSGK